MSDRIKKLGRELADQHMKGYAVGRREALADAKARIEDLHYGDDNLLIGTGYQLAVNDALAALTQPQTEIEGKPDGTWYDIPDGGGAATAAGAFDPDPLANPDCQECGNDDAGCLACGADANWDS